MGRPKKVKRRCNIPPRTPAPIAANHSTNKKMGRPTTKLQNEQVIKLEKVSPVKDFKADIKTVEKLAECSEDSNSPGSPKRKLGTSAWCLKRLKTDLKINEDEPPVLGKRTIVRPMYTEKFKYIRIEPQVKKIEELVVVAKKKLGRPKKTFSEDDASSPRKIGIAKTKLESGKVKQESETPKKLGRPKKLDPSAKGDLLESGKKKLGRPPKHLSGEVKSQSLKVSSNKRNVVNNDFPRAKKMKLDRGPENSEIASSIRDKSPEEQVGMKPGRKPNPNNSPSRCLTGITPGSVKKMSPGRFKLKTAQVKVEDCLTNLFNSKKCKFCKKTFETRNKYLMRRHLASVHGIEPFCKRCSAIFKNKEELAVHMKTCTALHNNQNKRIMREERRLQNKRLVAAIRQERLRKIQNKIREKLKILDPPAVEFDDSMSTTCPYCCKAIPFKYNLRRHIHTFHPDKQLFVENSVLYTCPYCHKIISNKFNLQRHMTVMHRDEVFCKYCWELFNREGELNNHVPKCLDGPHFNKKRRKWDCPWESKTIEKNMVKYETSPSEEGECQELPPDDSVECDKLKETLYGNMSKQEVACDDSEFYTPVNDETCVDYSFVISEIVEIYTTDENSSDLIGDNVINISAEAISVSSNFDLNLQKGIRILKNEDWDTMTESSLDESSMDLPLLSLQNTSLDESSMDLPLLSLQNTCSSIDLNIQALPVLTLKNQSVEEPQHDENMDKVYQVL